MKEDVIYLKHILQAVERIEEYPSLAPTYIQTILLS
jgi:hypothetical protein